MPRKKIVKLPTPPAAPPPPPSRFTQGFAALCYDRGWVLPEPYVVQIYEEHIRNLEGQIDTLTRARLGKRIDPVEKAIPS